MTDTPVGLTRDAGWEVGVSRTVALDPGAAWALLLSPAGLRAWLGDAPEALPAERGAAYATPGGTTGEVRSFRPGDRVRVTWQPPGRAEPATLQAVVRPAARGASLRLHAERLRDAAEREALRDRWRAALDELAAAAGAPG